MNLDEFKNHNESFKRRNPAIFDSNPSRGAEDFCEVPMPVVKPVVRDESVGPLPGEEICSKKFLLRVTLYRLRTIDPENVVTKHIAGDCLRYAGCLPDDDEKTIELQVRQKKVETTEEEGTLIELIPI